MSNRLRLWVPGALVRQVVRNRATGRILPCCWEDCESPGDTRFQVQVPHEQPRWRDALTGRQEMVVYIFCTERHKGFFVTHHRHIASQRGTGLSKAS